MLDFKKEIQKYKPILEVEDVENSINSDEIKDMMDILKQLSNQKQDTNNRWGEIYCDIPYLRFCYR